MSNEFPSSSKGPNIYFHISENSGVGYYRAYLPAITLREQGLANVMISDFRWGDGNHVEPDHELLFQIANWANLIVVERNDRKEFYAQWGGIKEFFNIPIVLDTDDDVRNVRPQNPGYTGYHPGAESLVWNKYAIRKEFDAITVSTENLVESLKKENPKIFHLPNNLDMKLWNSFEKKQWNDDKIRIGFIASAAHAEGVEIIKKPILEIMQKYSQVLFHITHVYHGAFHDFPEDIKKRILPIPWFHLKSFPQLVKEQGFDIGLAPLADNYFNRAKSNLRWMEYSAAKMATIASPVIPYRCIRNNIDGILAKEQNEWIIALDKLVNDAKFRNEMAENAYTRICTDFDIASNIKIWYNVYSEIIKKYTEYFGQKRTFIEIEQKKGRKKKYFEMNSKKRR